MKTIKELNLIIENENITIRSIRNKDLEYYKEWYKKGYILSDKVNDLTEDFIEKMMFDVIKMFLFLIIEIDNKPVGEITIWNDKTLFIPNLKLDKPYYSMKIKFYENIIDNDINMIIKLFVNSINKFKLKNGTKYSMIDREKEQNYEYNFISNGFEYLKKENYKNKLEKNFMKMGIENPYDKLIMLIKKLK